MAPVLPSKTRYALGKTRDAIESLLLGAVNGETVFHSLCYLQRAVERPGELPPSIRSEFDLIICDIVENRLALAGRIVTDSDILRLLKATYRLQQKIMAEIDNYERNHAEDKDDET